MSGATRPGGAADGTPLECARLAAELRVLRERSGLSLAALAEESAYSKSSWQRYLTGRALPPWLAVRALCRFAGEPEPRIRVLWELAEAAWSRRGSVERESTTAEDPVPAPEAQPRTQPAPEAEPAPTEAPPGCPIPARAFPLRRRRRPGPAAAVAVLVVCVAAALGTAVATGALDAPASTANAVRGGFHVLCTGAPCAGKDPGTMLCGVEPQTLLHVDGAAGAAGAGIEIRYNPLCRAVWARAWHTRLGDRLTVSAPGEAAQSVAVTDPRLLDAFVYTPLLPVPGRHAVLTVCLEGPPGGEPVCRRAPAP